MEYGAGQPGHGLTIEGDFDPIARSRTRSALLSARTNSRMPFWWLIAIATVIPAQFSCVFDGLTGSRPDRTSIGFTIVGPDTIGVDDTLAFTLTDRNGFSGTEPAVRILWSSGSQEKAQWVHLPSDSLGEGALVVRGSLDTAFVVGVDTGATWIAARLIAPELTEPIVDSVAIAVAPKLAFITQPRDSISTGEILSVAIAVLDGRGETVALPRHITLSLGLLNDSDSLVRVVDRANEAATFFFGDSIVQADDGVATYDSVRIFTPGSAYTLVASSGRLTRASSTPFRVGQLILRMRAGDGQSDTVDTQLEVAPAVELVNELGRPVRARDVKFRITAGDGRLSDSIATTNDSGIASVEWRLGTVADSANNALEALVPNAVDVQPIRFTATALPDIPDKLDLTTASSFQATCNTPFDEQPVVRLLDRFDNRNNDSLIQVTAEIVSGNGVLSGTLTVPTGAHGRAVFTDLSINGEVGNYPLRFTSPNLDPTASATVQLEEGPASQLTIITQPPATVESDEVFPTDPQIRVEDQCGNLLQNVEVTVALATGDGTLNGDETDDTNSNGLATFSNLSITPDSANPGDYQFTLQFSVSSPTVSPMTSNTIVVTVPQPTPNGAASGTGIPAVGSSGKPSPAGHP